MYYEYRVRHLDNVEYRGANVDDGVIEAESQWQAFVKICDKFQHTLYSTQKYHNADGRWIGCDVQNEDEVRKEIEENEYIHMHTGSDWDVEVSLSQVDKNEAYETVKLTVLKRHIYQFEIKLPIAKEDPDVDIKCRLKIWVAQEGNTVDYIVDVDFENNKLLHPLDRNFQWKGDGQPIDTHHEFDNIDEVFEHVRNYLGNL